jgi:hypothetical protein
VDSPGSGQGQMAGCCECGDERSGSGATELVASGKCFKNDGMQSPRSMCRGGRISFRYNP